MLCKICLVSCMMLKILRTKEIQNKEMVLHETKNFHTAMEQLIKYGYNLWIKRKHLQTEFLLTGKYLKHVRNTIN